MEMLLNRQYRKLSVMQPSPPLIGVSMIAEANKWSESEKIIREKSQASQKSWPSLSVYSYSRDTTFRKVFLILARYNDKNKSIRSLAIRNNSLAKVKQISNALRLILRRNASLRQRCSPTSLLSIRSPPLLLISKAIIKRLLLNIINRSDLLRINFNLHLSVSEINEQKSKITPYEQDHIHQPSWFEQYFECFLS